MIVWKLPLAALCVQSYLRRRTSRASAAAEPSEWKLLAKETLDCWPGAVQALQLSRWTLAGRAKGSLWLCVSRFLHPVRGYPRQGRFVMCVGRHRPSQSLWLARAATRAALT